MLLTIIVIIIFIVLLAILIIDVRKQRITLVGGKIKTPLMRVIFELSKDVEKKEIKNETWDVYDSNALDHYMCISKLYDTNKTFSDHYNRIMHILHPFDDIKNNIKSNLVSGRPMRQLSGQWPSR